MTTKTIDCVECGESVPYGRLACPACDALLASVADPRRPVDRPTDSARVPGVEPVAAAIAEPVEPEASSTPSPWPPLEEPEPVLVARPHGRAIPTAPDEPGPVAPPPGAYRPPSLAVSTAMAGAPDWPSLKPPTGMPRAESAGMAATAGPSALPSIDAARVLEIAGWFVIVGSAMAVLGFLLPWSMTVIGARNFGGYLDSWGLASPSHVLVLIGPLVALALGVVRTPVPEWLRTGVLGLALGGLLVGLTWPYLVGPLGADVGVLVTALGGLALVIGGGVASWATRHAEPVPVV